MFELSTAISVDRHDGSGLPAGSPIGLLAADLTAIAASLASVETVVDDAERVEQIRALEELKSAAAAAQALVTATFASSQEAAQRAAGVRAADVGKGIAAQVGLAKRESHAKARRSVGFAKVLASELPHTFAALQRGETTEWRAMLVARQTACLTLEHRRLVDAELGPRLQAWGDRQVEAETRRLAAKLDPYAVAARARRAEAERRVSLRPAPDTMAYLTALLPVAQGVAALAALKLAADTCRADGDPRSRGQVMADTLVERLTGQTTADAVPVAVNLVMTDTALLDAPGAASPEQASEEPAVLEGYGPVPAPWARDLIRRAPEGAAWLRRLFTDPETGDLVAMESRRRTFTGLLREFLIRRDQVCRTPWCDAPIRHLDHVEPAAHGGPTSAANGQGYCEACNHAKEAPGWTTTAVDDDAGIAVTTVTPTGHAYDSRPPRPPGAPPADGLYEHHRRRSRWPSEPARPDMTFAEALFADLLAA